MRTWLVFLGGALLGLMVGILLPTHDREDFGKAPRTVSSPPPRTAEPARAAGNRSPAAERRAVAASDLPAEFRERIQEAARNPTPESPAAVSQPSGLKRVQAWLATVQMDGPLQEAIEEELLKAYGEDSGDPLRAGSRLDGWLREQLDAATLASWESLQAEHVEDLVERRTNVLFSGLQGALALDSSQKDSLYQEIAEVVRYDLQVLGRGELVTPEQMEESLTAYSERLANSVPADQQPALREWLAGNLPGFWLSELRSSGLAQPPVSAPPGTGGN